MKKTIILLFFFISVNFLFPQDSKSLMKITPDDRSEGDCFGWATAINNDFLVVGSPEIRFRLNQRRLQEVGAVYIFKKRQNGNWIQTQKLLADTPKTYDFFGGSVSLFDSFLAIGCKGADDSIDIDSQNRNGAVYLFRLTKEDKWVKSQKVKLKNSLKSDNFGFDVCLKKSLLVISAPGRILNKSNNTGSVYVYELLSNGVWQQKQEIISPDKNSFWFGKKISVSDSLLIVTTESSRYVYLYKLGVNKKFNFLTKLTSTDSKDKKFGSSVCVNGNDIIVGAEGEYEHNGGNAGVDTLLIDNREKYLLGSGSVYIYTVSNNKCIFKQRITASDNKADMHFGMCLSISDSLLVVGAFGDKLDGINIPDNHYAGAAYIFKKQTNGYWIETKKIIPEYRSTWDKFAFSVSAYEKNVIIGSRFEKENAQEKLPLKEAGAVYIYSEK